MLVTRKSGEPSQKHSQPSHETSSELALAGKKLVEVCGCVRVITDARGELVRLVGTEPSPQKVVPQCPGGRQRQFSLRPGRNYTVERLP
jgi:hypothetical protein